MYSLFPQSHIQQVESINQMENPTTITVGGSNIAAQLTKQHNFLNILYIYYKIRYSIFYRRITPGNVPLFMNIK